MEAHSYRKRTVLGQPNACTINCKVPELDHDRCPNTSSTTISCIVDLAGFVVMQDLHVDGPCRTDRHWSSSISLGLSIGQPWLYQGCSKVAMIYTWLAGSLTLRANAYCTCIPVALDASDGPSHPREVT